MEPPYFQSRKFGIGINDGTSPLRDWRSLNGPIRYLRIGQVCREYIAEEGLTEGWRRTLREVWILKIQSARPAEVHFNLVKPECKNQNRLGQSQ